VKFHPKSRRLVAPRIAPKKEISSWESNLKPGYYRNVCFDCQQDVIGGLPNGVEPITQVDSIVYRGAQ
jgi:hypothetical protein